MTKRGIVKVKGKGDVNTYWLNEHNQETENKKNETTSRHFSLRNNTNKENAELLKLKEAEMKSINGKNVAEMNLLNSKRNSSQILEYTENSPNNKGFELKNAQNKEYEIQSTEHSLNESIKHKHGLLLEKKLDNFSLLINSETNSMKSDVNTSEENSLNNSQTGDVQNLKKLLDIDKLNKLEKTPLIHNEMLKIKRFERPKEINLLNNVENNQGNQIPIKI